MQYLLNEVRGKDSISFGGALPFDSVPDVMKHLRKINKNKRMLIGDDEATAEKVLALLQERLSTVSITLERREAGEERIWTIIAF